MSPELQVRQGRPVRRELQETQVRRDRPVLLVLPVLLALQGQPVLLVRRESQAQPGQQGSQVQLELRDRLATPVLPDLRARPA